MQKRLIIFIILTLLIPISALYISYRYSLSYFETNSEMAVNNARVLTNELITKVEKNFYSINDYAVFKKNIEPELIESEVKMQIIGLDGKILFDSEASEMVHRYVDMKSTLQYDLFFKKTNPDLLKFTYPILSNGDLVANGVFTIPSKKLMIDSPSSKSFNLILPVILGVEVIILYIAYLLIKIMTNLLIPVKNLKNAAYEISRGNLDAPIEYKRNDDLSTVFIAYDTMRAELKDSLKKQAEYEKAHKELIACISHDLKTPISSIKAYVEAIGDGLAKDKETLDRYITVIRKKTDSLTKLIEDLFQHSKMQLQKLEIKKTELYSGAMLNTILDPIKIQFENTDIDFIVNPPLPDVLIDADSQRIDQVIVNFVQNAKKYMPQGGTIEFSAAVENNSLKVSVKDTGPGILPQDMPHIFQPFYRGDKSRTSNVEGSGLGLSICKYIVEEHGGEISAKSSVNGGSTFAFTIPKI